MKNKLCNFFSLIHSYKIRDIYLKQCLIAGLFILGLVIAGLGISFLVRDKKNDQNSITTKNPPIKIELAEAALDLDKMWRNHFEDMLVESDNIMKEQINNMSHAFHVESEELKIQNKLEISELKQQLILAQNDLRDALHEITEMKNQQNSNAGSDVEAPNRHISLINISNDPNILITKDSKPYIPETSYVRGILLGGMAVSTSVGSPSEPVPVVIRITDRGNLPKNFNTDLKQCRILGSGYGDLSSERAVIRAEVMICLNKLSDEVITTKISGVIYGDDGMNGIKGRVVDMSNKHIRNAAIGGILSGFANTMKSEGQFALGALGSLQTQRQNTGDKLRNNSLSGMGNSAEKIADYYIKQAENMSPILLIPGGTQVDVVFTKGIYLGSVDVIQKISNEAR